MKSNEKRRWAISPMLEKCSISIFLLVAALIFQLSCSQEKVIIDQSPEPGANDLMAMDQILSILEAHQPAYMDGRKKMVSFEKPDFPVKVEKEVPGLHVALYEHGDKKGFMILSANRRTSPILAYGEFDDLSAANVSEMPEALKLWMQKSEEEVKRVRQGALLSDDEYADQVYAVIYPPDDDGGGDDGGGGSGCGTYQTFEYGPLLATRWGQGCPYNQLAPQSCATADNCDRARAGCVAVAIAQIMRYHEWPNNYNWGIMEDRYFLNDLGDPGAWDVAHLMRLIGASVNMNYGCESSWSLGWAHSPNLYERAFDDFFYSNNGNTAQYYGQTVANDIKTGNPVLLSGCEGSLGAGCHAWVCDGYRNMYNNCYGHTYYHMNWGWNGTWNGWFGANWSVDGDTYDQWKRMHTSIRP